MAEQPSTQARLRIGVSCFVIIVAIIALGCLGIALHGPITSAIEIGGDEHYEVTKALLWANGYKIYGAVWNDQPPIYTVLLGTLFHLFGPGIGVARALAGCYGLLLLSVFFLLVRRRCGLLAGSAAVVALIVSPEVLQLSISSMLEVPAFATALAALWFLYRWAENRQWLWLVASGAIFAIALQTKLTAGIALPAFMTEILLLTRRNLGTPWGKDSILTLSIWGAAILTAFLAVGALLGSGYEQSWLSHFSSATRENPRVVERSFSFGTILAHTEALCGAVLALILVILKKDYRRMAFPIVLLATVTVVHAFHHPWWFYYYLHFALPLSWLTGYCVAELFSVCTAFVGKRRWRQKIIGYCGMLAGSIVITLLILDGGQRLTSDVCSIRRLPRLQQNELIAKMKQYGTRTQFVYTLDTIYAFHSGLLLVPELAVLPSKRFWSKQISNEQVVEILRRYRPEQMLFDRGYHLDADLSGFLDEKYQVVYDDGYYRLFAANSILSSNSYR